MKKSVIFLFVGFILYCFLAQGVDASVGVSPGKYNLDFSPGYEGDFTFNFIFDKDVESEIYVDGDFKEYATLSVSKLIGGGPVNVHVKLPEKAEKAGINKLLIGARQVSTSGGFSIAGNVIARIEIKVPYPGKYAEVFFDVTNANAGEEVNFTVRIDNLGSDSIVVNPIIKISELSNKSIEDLSLETKEIISNEYFIYQFSHPTQGYKAGDYKAFLFVDYGGNAAYKEKIFRLGKLYVAIINYSQEFVKDKINRFDVEVESFWNDPINNLYADISIPDYNVTFITPSVNLRPWERITLNGFFDTSSIQANEFQAVITLHYYEQNTSKSVDLHFKKERSYQIIIIIAVVIFILLLFVIISVLVRKLVSQSYLVKNRRIKNLRKNKEI